MLLMFIKNLLFQRTWLYFPSFIPKIYVKIYLRIFSHPFYSLGEIPDKLLPKLGQSSTSAEFCMLQKTSRFCQKLEIYNWCRYINKHIKKVSSFNNGNLSGMKKVFLRPRRHRTLNKWLFLWDSNQVKIGQKEWKNEKHLW